MNTPMTIEMLKSKGVQSHWCDDDFWFEIDNLILYFDPNSFKWEMRIKKEIKNELIAVGETYEDFLQAYEKATGKEFKESEPKDTILYDLYDEPLVRGKIDTPKPFNSEVQQQNRDKPKPQNFIIPKSPEAKNQEQGEIDENNKD